MTADNGNKVFFHYIKLEDRSNPVVSYGISDFSNAPFDRIIYKLINHVGKRWIQKYTLALTKEMLGAVRAKFSSIPIPNADITLDGSDLRSEAATEKEILTTELRENLEAKWIDCFEKSFLFWFRFFLEKYFEIF